MSDYYIEPISVPDLPVFVVADDILVEHPVVVPGYKDGPVRPPSALQEAHIVIPIAVVQKLAMMDPGRTTYYGSTPRSILEAIRELNLGVQRNINDHYRLDCASAFVGLDGSKRALSILPVHKNFVKSLLFAPPEDDMDGQIILAALAATFIKQGWAIDGSYSNNYPILPFDDSNGIVTLLTDNDCLGIRAAAVGVTTKRWCDLVDEEDYF